MKNLVKLIKKSHKIALFSHISPDPDTIGSTLAFYYALKSLKKEVSLFCDDENLEKFSFLNAEKLYNISNPNEKFDLCIAVDVSAIDRIGKFGEVFLSASSSARVDHHQVDENFAYHNIMKPYSACAILIYELITLMKLKITPDIATLLYFGICGDTGGFRFSNTDSLTFDVCSKLLSFGADIRCLYSEFFDKKTVPSLKLSSHALLSAKINDTFGFVIMKVSSSDYQKYGADESEYIGNIPNMYLNCGYKLACIIKEKSDGIKASLRSKPEYDCAQIAAVFGGGGHKNASGIKFSEKISLADAENLLENEIKNYFKSYKGEN